MTDSPAVNIETFVCKLRNTGAPGVGSEVDISVVGVVSLESLDSPGSVIVSPLGFVPAAIFPVIELAVVVVVAVASLFALCSPAAAQSSFGSPTLAPPDAEAAAHAAIQLFLSAQARLDQALDQHSESRVQAARRLHAEATSFAAVIDEVRRVRAFERLADPALSAAEVAFLLGYAEPAAFHHAFKRWTDQTPQQWRAARSA